MPAEPGPEPKSIFRSPLLYTSILIGIALLYTGAVFLSRWQENRALERRVEEKKREEARRTVELMGGNRLEIQSFLASPGVIQRGETAQICYAVANAKTVTLEPPAKEEVWPSYSRCVNVAPEKATTYTLTAEDGQGHKETATLTVQVR
jgi:hypothetical protein